METVLKNTNEYLRLKEDGWFPEAITKIEQEYWEDYIKNPKTPFSFTESPSESEMEKFYNALVCEELDEYEWTNLTATCEIPKYGATTAPTTDDIHGVYGSNAAIWNVGDYTLKYEACHGGEDQGSDYWFVFSIVNTIAPDKKTYWKVHGWYASHVGSEYEGIGQVEPKEVTVIRWQSKGLNR